MCPASLIALTWYRLRLCWSLHEGVGHMSTGRCQGSCNQCCLMEVFPKCGFTIQTFANIIYEPFSTLTSCSVWAWKKFTTSSHQPITKHCFWWCSIRNGWMMWSPGRTGHSMCCCNSRPENASLKTRRLTPTLLWSWRSNTQEFVQAGDGNRNNNNQTNHTLPYTQDISICWHKLTT